MLTILAGVATWEREIMLERQREGIGKARASTRAAIPRLAGSRLT
jgi:DNA invertase Pin-like site-specific DNA recombinase